MSSPLESGAERPPLLAGDPADPDPTDCPRSITFTLSGTPGVTIHAEEGKGDFAGDLVFTATVNNTATLEGDLGGLFFQFNESKLSGLTVTGDVPLTFQTDPTGGDKIIDLGGGVNMRGAGTTGFDLGILFATTSTHQDITTASFVISDPQHDLKLEDLHDPGESSQVGVRVISVGSPNGPRHASEKLTGFAPYPPTALPDDATTDEDVPVTIKVLENDTDANGSLLTIDRISQQPTYGSVTINTDGTLTYTPFLDAVIDGTAITTNQDTFEYCVHDALGGEDHATVTVTVIPVAEAPSISLSVVGVGASASDTLIRVTAISEDFGTRTEGSDFIQSLQLNLTGNFVQGVTFSDDQGLLDPSTNIITTFGQPGTFTDVIHVNTAALNGLTVNLDDLLTITAVAAETEAPTATASASKSQPIQIDYSTAAASVDFTTQDQNIWGPGNAFTFDYHKFLGISDGSDGFQDGTVSGLKKFGGTIGGHYACPLRQRSLRCHRPRHCQPQGGLPGRFEHQRRQLQCVPAVQHHAQRCLQ
jgi:VCBS repeat-containing protein